MGNVVGQQDRDGQRRQAPEQLLRPPDASDKQGIALHEAFVDCVNANKHQVRRYAARRVARSVVAASLRVEDVEISDPERHLHDDVLGRHGVLVVAVFRKAPHGVLHRWYSPPVACWILCSTGPVRHVGCDRPMGFLAPECGAHLCGQPAGHRSGYPVGCVGRAVLLPTSTAQGALTHTRGRSLVRCGAANWRCDEHYKLFAEHVNREVQRQQEQQQQQHQPLPQPTPQR